MLSVLTLDQGTVLECGHEGELWEVGFYLYPFYIPWLFFLHQCYFANLITCENKRTEKISWFWISLKICKFSDQKKKKAIKMTYLARIKFFSIRVHAVLFDFISNLFQNTFEVIKLGKEKTEPVFRSIFQLKF